MECMLFLSPSTGELERQSPQSRSEHCSRLTVSEEAAFYRLTDLTTGNQGQAGAAEVHLHGHGISHMVCRGTEQSPHGVTSQKPFQYLELTHNWEMKGRGPHLLSILQTFAGGYGCVQSSRSRLALMPSAFTMHFHLCKHPGMFVYVLLINSLLTVSLVNGMLTI
jgi:hypothetical protein